MKLFIANLIASGLGSGYGSKAPGTVGSMVFLLLWLLFYSVNQDPFFFFTFSVALAVVGTFTVHIVLTEGDADDKDPKWVVIDEWAGLALSLLPIYINPSFPPHILALFLFTAFRFLDILKPFPVSKLEALPGAFGVMADDIGAGAIILISCLCLF